MAKSVLIAVLLVMATGVAQSASLQIQSVPVDDLFPGFAAYTVSIETEPEETLRGMDVEITGPLNQIFPFGALYTVFMDFNHIFETDLGPYDTQFLFASNEVLSIGAEESDTYLRGAISGLAGLNLPNPAPLVQIVTDSPGCIRGTFDFDLGGDEAVRFEIGPLLLDAECVPEPGAVLLAFVPIAVFSLNRPVL